MGNYDRTKPKQVQQSTDNIPRKNTDADRVVGTDRNTARHNHETNQLRLADKGRADASGAVTSQPGWYVYVLLLADSSLYCGITNDVTKRLDKHEKGKGSKYVRSRLPVRGILVVSAPTTKSEALKREAAFKKLGRFEKKMEAVCAMEQERREYLMQNDGFVRVAAKKLGIAPEQVTWKQREAVRNVVAGIPYAVDLRGVTTGRMSCDKPNKSNIGKSGTVVGRCASNKSNVSEEPSKLKSWPEQ